MINFNGGGRNGWIEKPCCDKPACNYDNSPFDCEGCGCNCDECGYLNFLTWKATQPDGIPIRMPVF